MLFRQQCADLHLHVGHGGPAQRREGIRQSLGRLAQMVDGDPTRSAPWMESTSARAPLGTHAAEYVRDNLREFELTRTGVTAGEVLVSRVAPEALEDAHHPLPSRKAR
jgi:hypothetical protein